MDKLLMIFSFLAALSLATERITEVIKGIPPLSRWFAVEKASGSNLEEFRKASIQLLAIVIGTILASLVHDNLPMSLSPNQKPFWIDLIFGAMASGGSGLWNSALDIVREVNKQKQMLTEQTRSARA